MYKNHTCCRVCNSDKLTPYLDLGFLPLSNNLAESSIKAINKERFPLQVLFCEQCYLSQLSIVIDPHEMFSHYVYRSSISQGYVNHCRQMAKDLKRYGLTKDSFMIDIAGNDGALLKEFKSEIGLKILNVDPAENLRPICEAAGIPVETYFWGKGTAEIVFNKYGKADLITATNVFAHVDDAKEFIYAASGALKPGGVLVLEFPYLINFIEENQFDTIYFEHLSIFSIAPLKTLCDRLRIKVLSVERQSIHGGTVRVIIGNGESDSSVKDFIDTEKTLGYNKVEKYQQWALKVTQNINDLKYRLSKLKYEGKRIAAFAASAKGNTLLNCANITNSTIDFIVDETPEKIGKYSPGTGIPILPMEHLIENQSDYLIVLSWNFLSEIMEKCSRAGYRGKYIVPIPEFKILTNFKHGNNNSRLQYGAGCIYNSK